MPRSSLLFVLLPLSFLALNACGIDGEGGGDSSDEWVPPPPPEHGVQLSIDSLVLQPGEEIEKCRTAKAPALTGGMVTRIELVARPGLHHTVVYKLNQDLDPDEVDDQQRKLRLGFEAKHDLGSRARCAVLTALHSSAQRIWRSAARPRRLAFRLARPGREATVPRAGQPGCGRPGLVRCSA